MEFQPQFANTAVPPQPVTLHDLGQLTMRANVAFAARCARRLRPRLQLSARDSKKQERTAAVDTAIQAAEEYARGIGGTMAMENTAASAAFDVGEATGDSTFNAAYAAGYAARASHCASRAAQRRNLDLVLEVVAAVFGASRVLQANCQGEDYLVVSALRADYEKLKGLDVNTVKEIGKPIDSSEAGPLGSLWPQGAPYWFNTGKNEGGS